MRKSFTFFSRNIGNVGWQITVRVDRGTRLPEALPVSNSAGTTLFLCTMVTELLDSRRALHSPGRFLSRKISGLSR